MRHRLRFGIGLTLLLVMTGLIIWQGSFTVGPYGPSTPEQTYVFWGLSTLIFLLTVLLGFMLFRDAIKLYAARRAGVEGSRIRTKIVAGALCLTILPMIFLVIWSVEVLNRNLDKWFSRPGENIKANLQDIGAALERETQMRGDTLARWLAGSSEIREFLKSGHVPAGFFGAVCAGTGVEEAFIQRTDGGSFAICRAGDPPPEERDGEPRRAGKEKTGMAPLPDGAQVVVRVRMPADLAESEREIRTQIEQYNALASARRETRRFYIQLLLLITVFILFVAAWVALFLARLITGPVTALLDAARAVRGGDLSHRVVAPAIDEFATLVRAFNEMTAELETNRGELERRRRFIEAVLESIPSGVVSLDRDGAIRLTNGALRGILKPRSDPPARLYDLLPADYEGDLGRMLKRARRTGMANRQIELRSDEGLRNISLTVSALDARVTSGFVMVVEDTSDLLRAQKMAAWHEVARRVAHELKNPITPILLSAERIVRQLERTHAPAEVKRIIEECCSTILREVESVKTLVDEFAQYARWPAARLEPGNLNAVVEEALSVFRGRLEGIELHVELDPELPPALIDREQMRRVLVNLVDNAAESMRESPLRQIRVATHALHADTLELVIADTGTGIPLAERERLFLPYFSTKQRGTGLGLAIVSQIVAEHRGHIRVEDNRPAGTRFIIEIPASSAPDAEPRGAKAHAERTA
jgi:nitrogen fixation/metabolism regulation signal transduction histidine kinase